MLKPINEQYNNGRGDSLYEQAEEEKVVIKTPAPPVPAAAPPAPPAAPAAPPAPPAAPPAAPAAPGGPGGFPTGEEDFGDEDMDIDMEMGGEDMDMDMEMGGEESFDELEQTPTVKSIQKLTGKLGQKMREYEDEMDSDMIKYVLNSVISAVDLEELDDEDRDDIVSRLEPELEDEYGMEDKFDIDDEDIEIDVEDEEDMGGVYDEMGVEDEVTGLEESLKSRVNSTLKKYFKESKYEKKKRYLKESKVKKYIRQQLTKK